MKIYIDIDGVILKKDGSIPDFGLELIDFLTTNHQCYWLTTHCRQGSNHAIKYLSASYPESVLEQLSQIKPVDWTDLKTEGIELASDFIWLEDYPLEAEKKVLKAVDKQDSLITIDLNRENELRNVMQRIQKLTTA